MLHLSARFLGALGLVACLLALGCEQRGSNRGPVSQEQPLRIITTIKPVQLIVQDLIDPSLSDLVKVSLLMPPDVSPHGFEPTPSQMARLKQADIVIYNGLGLDDWAVRDMPRGTVALRFADVLSEEELHQHHHDHHHHDHSQCDHDHGPIDEHFWLDAEMVRSFAGMCAAEIGRQLSGIVDDSHGVMQSRLAAFEAAVDSTDSAYRAALSGHAGRRLVTHHNVFSRIADRYGLGESVVLRPVEMLEPSPSDIRRAIEAIRADSLSFVLIEPQFSPAAARTIAEETSARLIQVDPLGGDADSWAEMMQSLLDALMDGLGD